MTHNADSEARYSVGDVVTVEYDDEGETDTITGTITGFKPHSDTGEPGIWLKYYEPYTRSTLISWWSVESIVAPPPNGSSGTTAERPPLQ